MTIAYITHPSCLLHQAGLSHLECADRLRVIKTHLWQSPLCDVLVEYEAPAATREQLLRVHSAKYIDWLYQQIPTEGFVKIDEDTILNPASYQAALHAAGAAVYGVDLVMQEQTKLAFCAVRPPGHHASQSTAMGFCFFNNVAVAAAHALTYPGIKRIAVIDFDVHQGNGTEAIFQNRSQILICSLFEAFLFPFNPPHSAKNIISIPLLAGTGSREFRAEFTQHALEPLLTFKPDLLLVSAGFDAHTAETIANLNLIERDYWWIGQQIREIAAQCCRGRVVSVLEGGYALPVLGQSVAAYLQGLQ